ncbi:AraC family transcriptional regulator [Paenibacillus turpanensis]|uniref:AraC family transcriptional regulator n=1 Tax=Paenibacillus turpanensis TaxID=2689078 RepID=UPI00140AD830|nr:AraC family transcriptional regulator [Paenibacillus turpanensis]
MQEPFFIERVARTGYFAMDENHMHAGYELYYLLSGEREYFIQDKTYRIQAGDLVFINKYDLHKTLDTGVPQHERILINFTKSFLGGLDASELDLLFSSFQNKNRVLRTAPEERKLVERLLEQMLAEQRSDLRGTRLYTRTLLAQLLLCSARMFETRLEAPYTAPSPKHEKISEVITYIHGQYMEPLTLEEIAGRFYMSPFHLSRAFKQVTGFNFIEFLTSTRIKEGQRLLRNTNMRITDIAEQTGFSDSSHFTRVFKRICGLTPKEYRNEQSRQRLRKPAGPQM